MYLSIFMGLKKDFSTLKPLISISIGFIWIIITLFNSAKTILSRLML